LQLGQCQRLCSPAFATFARIIEESPALQAKELAVMARFTSALRSAIESELHVPAVDATVAANMLVGVQWQFFRDARVQALAGRHGPAAARRLRVDLERAYQLLGHGIGDLGVEGPLPPAAA
jgi:hypothetical protein